MTLSEKAAYLKGLMDGMKLDESKDENRLMKTIVDLLQDMAVSVDDLEDNAIAVSDELDEIEESLDAIDEFLLDEDEDDYEDYDDDDFDFDDDDDEMYEVKCPNCGEVIAVDEATILKDSFPCPNCGEKLEPEFDEDDGEDIP